MALNLTFSEEPRGESLAFCHAFDFGGHRIDRQFHALESFLQPGDARLGEVPCAFVTVRSNRSVTEAELIQWAKARCANFRVPRYLRIVESFEAIGMTASGKVQKTKLREHALREFNL